MEYPLFTVKENWNPLSLLLGVIEESMAEVLDRNWFFQVSVFLRRSLKRKACDSQDYRSDTSGIGSVLLAFSVSQQHPTHPSPPPEAKW